MARQALPPRASNTTTFVTSARRDRPVAPHRRRWNSPRIHSSSSLSSGGRVCSHLRKRYLQVPSHRRHDLVVDPYNLSARVECQVRPFCVLFSFTPLAPLTRPSYLKAPNVEDAAVDSIPEKVMKDATRDFWLNAEEALKYGIILYVTCISLTSAHARARNATG